MREIKFRCWNDEGQQISHDYITRDGLAHWKENSIPTTTREIEQYTGLKDKNGREIYEGDICNCPETGVDGTIVFHNGRFTWTDGACHWDMVLNSKDGQPRDSVIPEADDLVIIGNIHENPELVK